MQAPDTQLLFDLHLLPDHPGERSVLTLLNKTRTYGGRDALKQILQTPANTMTDVRQRQEMYLFVGQHLTHWRITTAHAYVAAIETYVTTNIAFSRAADVYQFGFDAIRMSVFYPYDFARLRAGVLAVQRLLSDFRPVAEWLSTHEYLPEKIRADVITLRQFYEAKEIKSILRQPGKPLSKLSIIGADYVFRKSGKEALRCFLEIFYRFDAYESVARFMTESPWSLPVFVDTEETCFELTGAFHPLVPSAVGNDFRLTKSAHLALLTGANMSGKTTFIKTCGLIVYLAHLGLPVPATSARMNFFDELHAAIHLSDKLTVGHSHFYTEILRIRSVADDLAVGKRVFFVCDELFRGTNYPDALSCSVRVIDAFRAFRKSAFLISSHSFGLADRVGVYPEVGLVCFRTQVLNGKLHNTYQIQEGIAEERIGEYLLDQAGLFVDIKKAGQPDCPA